MHNSARRRARSIEETGRIAGLPGTLTRNAPLTVYEPNSLSGFGSQSQLASEFEEVSRLFREHLPDSLCGSR